MLWRILLNLRADRHRPPLEQLDAEDDPERFLWRILPHAARTFSLCIVFLPPRMVRALAIAYLYCRILDTYEDLADGVEAKTASLRRFVLRFDLPAEAMGPPLRLDPALAGDDRDRAHVLLVNRVERVDAVFRGLPVEQQQAIRRLVRRMGDGMIWSSDVFDRQSGGLRSGGQLSRYCWNVLGTTMLFAEEMQRLDAGLGAELEDERWRVCARAGEAIQLANITRDVDKDLLRGIAYHPELEPTGADRGPVDRCRHELLLRAIARGKALQLLVEGMPFPRISRARGAAFLLVLTTYAYYRKACARFDLPVFDPGPRVGVLRGTWWYLGTVLSARRASSILARLSRSYQTALDRAGEAARRPMVLDEEGFDVVEWRRSEDRGAEEAVSPLSANPRRPLEGRG